MWHVRQQEVIQELLTMPSRQGRHGLEFEDGGFLYKQIHVVQLMKPGMGYLDRNFRLTIAAMCHLVQIEFFVKKSRPNSR